MESTAIEFRSSDSNLVFPVWHAIRDLEHNKRPATRETITAFFIDHIPQCSVKHMVSQLDSMCSDKLLRNLRDSDSDNEDDETFALPLAAGDAGNSPRSNDTYDGSESSVLRLNVECRISRTRDFYCYECHRPGPVFSCADCPRVFHAHCVRNADNLDLPMLPLREPVPEIVARNFQLAFDFAHNSARARPSTGNTMQSQRLCIRCRLQKRNAQHLRPLTSVAELHELLDFSFTRIRQWLNRDTFSAQEGGSLAIPPNFVRVLTPVLFTHLRTLVDIGAAIKAQRYRSLVDYMVDIMDVMHCIGVLRGTKCPEYEAAKYLQIDALLDIVEMTRCQDCFRQSNDRSDPQWFIRPCTVPHKLVFAKLPGFSYWPAKVIRQIRSAGAATQFDVRFFGKDHMRALIGEKAIVLDGRPTALKMSFGLKKALAEMAEHKELLKQQQAADGEAVEAAVAQAVSPIKASATPLSPPSEVKRGRGRPRKSTTPVAPEKAAPTTNNRGPVKRKSAAGIPAPKSVRNGRRSTMTAAATAAAAAAVAAMSTNSDDEDEEEEENNVFSSSSVKRGRRSTITATALAKSNADNDSDREGNTAPVAPAAKRARKSTNEPSAQVATSASATNSLPRQSKESDSDSEKETTDDDDEEGDGNCSSEKSAADEVVRDKQAVANPANVQQPSRAWIISNLRRKMAGCPPQFVCVAVEMMSDQLNRFDVMRQQYEQLRQAAGQKHLCTVCLRPAKYQCCSHKIYCSERCRTADWIDKHHLHHCGSP